MCLPSLSLLYVPQIMSVLNLKFHSHFPPRSIRLSRYFTSSTSLLEASSSSLPLLPFLLLSVSLLSPHISLCLHHRLYLSLSVFIMWNIAVSISVCNTLPLSPFCLSLHLCLSKHLPFATVSVSPHMSVSCALSVSSSHSLSCVTLFSLSFLISSWRFCRLWWPTSMPCVCLSCLSVCAHVCMCVFRGCGWVVALLSALVGWAHLSLRTGDLWSRLPASRIATLTELWKSLSIAHRPNWITSSALLCARFLNGWFKAHTHVHAHTQTTAMHEGKHSCVFPPFSQQEDTVLPFHRTLVLIDFWLSSSQCLCLCLCILICRQGFCFHHTVSAVYGELFASQDVYSASFLPTALHICCHFITDIYLTLCACQDTLDKSHCYFVCFHTPEWKGKAENGLIFYFQQLFLLV